MDATKRKTNYNRIDTLRMKDIIAQLADVIYLQSRAKKSNMNLILEQFTNITAEECDILQIKYPNDQEQGLMAMRSSK